VAAPRPALLPDSGHPAGRGHRRHRGLCEQDLAGGQGGHPCHPARRDGEETQRAGAESPRGAARPIGKDGGARDPRRRRRARPEQHPRRHGRLPGPAAHGTTGGQSPATGHHHDQAFGREGGGHRAGSPDPGAPRRAGHGTRGAQPNHHGLPEEPRIPAAAVVPPRDPRRNRPGRGASSDPGLFRAPLQGRDEPGFERRRSHALRWRDPHRDLEPVRRQDHPGLRPGLRGRVRRPEDFRRGRRDRPAGHQEDLRALLHEENHGPQRHGPRHGRRLGHGERPQGLHRHRERGRTGDVVHPLLPRQPIGGEVRGPQDPDRGLPREGGDDPGRRRRRGTEGARLGHAPQAGLYDRDTCQRRGSRRVPEEQAG